MRYSGGNYTRPFSSLVIRKARIRKGSKRRERRDPRRLPSRRGISRVPSIRALAASIRASGTDRSERTLLQRKLVFCLGLKTGAELYMAQFAGDGGLDACIFILIHVYWSGLM